MTYTWYKIAIYDRGVPIRLSEPDRLLVPFCQYDFFVKFQLCGWMTNITVNIKWRLLKNSCWLGNIYGLSFPQSSTTWQQVWLLSTGSFQWELPMVASQPGSNQGRSDVNGARLGACSGAAYLKLLSYLFRRRSGFIFAGTNPSFSSLNEGEFESNDRPKTSGKPGRGRQSSSSTKALLVLP